MTDMLDGLRGLLGAALIACLVMGGTASAAELPDFTDMVERNGAAVVNISTTQEGSKAHQRIPPELEGTPFEKFFERFLGEGPRQEREAQSLGSGVVISPDGYVITNAHVIKNASKIVVQFNDRRQMEAELVGKDPTTDIALLKVDGSGLPAAEIGDPSQLEVGEWVVAIGAPFGFENSVTAGIVSAKSRSLPNDTYVPFIQTDAAVNPGNSGGPLFNMNGEVVGINAQIFSKSGGFMGLSFAIPIDMAMDAVEQIKEHGSVKRGWLGVHIQDVSPELAESFGMDKPKGALVARVIPDSPAEKAGLKSGDVVVAVEGETIGSASDLPPKIGTFRPGDKVGLTVIRDGARRSLTARVGSLEKARSGEDGERAAAVQEVLGMQIGPVPDRVRENMGLPDKRGALVREVTGDPAASAGVRSGDVILKLAQRTITGPEHFAKLVERLPSGRAVPMLVRRGEGAVFLPIRIP
jgi:serine protease Do